LTREQGAGYYPAHPEMLLKEGKYRIVRKLGYGSRSSVWLVAEVQEPKYKYKAVKILTVHATETSSSELEILQAIQMFGEDERELSGHHLPKMQDHFREKGPHGEHLCLVLNVLGPDLDAFRRSTPNKLVPVYGVKVLMQYVLEGLCNLHQANIVHRAVKSENFLVWVPATLDSINQVLSNSRVEESEIEVDGVKYPIVRSQPIPHNLQWDDPPADIERSYGVSLNSVGHAKKFTNPSDANVDIQAIGSATYELITGKSLPVGNLELSAVELALTECNILRSNEVTPAAVFIHACLQNTPTEDLVVHDWLTYSNRVASV